MLEVKQYLMTGFKMQEYVSSYNFAEHQCSSILLKMIEHDKTIH